MKFDLAPAPWLIPAKRTSVTISPASGPFMPTRSDW